MSLLSLVERMKEEFGLSYVSSLYVDFSDLICEYLTEVTGKSGNGNGVFSCADIDLASGYRHYILGFNLYATLCLIVTGKHKD